MGQLKNETVRPAVKALKNMGNKQVINLGSKEIYKVWIDGVEYINADYKSGSLKVPGKIGIKSLKHNRYK
jgi:hypothetical protein